MARRINRWGALLVVLLASGCTESVGVGSLPDGSVRSDGGASTDGASVSGDAGEDTSSVGDATATDSGVSGGAGNGVLFVDATASASEERDNASTPQGFVTDFTVDVQRAGVAVIDAQVVVRSSGGVLSLNHVGNGRYSARQTGYFQFYELDVSAGADEVRGVRARGPAIHTITRPTAGERVTAGADLEVTWSAPDVADEAIVETRDLAEQTTADDGSYTVPGSALAGSAGQDEDDRVRVRRSNVQEIAGGSASSDFTIRLRNQIQFVIASL